MSHRRSFRTQGRSIATQPLTSDASRHSSATRREPLAVQRGSARQNRWSFRLWIAALIVAGAISGRATAQTPPPAKDGPAVAAADAPPAASKPNELTPAEKAAGWKLLFDGKSPAGWKAYAQTAFPAKGWVVEDGCLKVQKEGGGGDIVTADEYGDFEFSVEWRASKGANSGIIYRASEALDAPWMTGPEYQILDDENWPEKPTKPEHTAGGMFDICAPATEKVLHPAGEFNESRIRLKDGVVQHYLNGAKVVECRVDNDEWKKKIAGSKFANYKGFGMQAKGRIALQDHGNEVCFRNIKVRDLSAKMPGEVALFNGADLAGWTYFLSEKGALADVWSVKDGVLICKGNPVGYIRTEKDYTNFVLKLEWRWNPQTKQTGNSGVLCRVQPPDNVWPRSVEAQLQHENAGDFWNIGDFKMKTVAARTNGRNTKKTSMSEKPVGEWNEYEIIFDHGRVTLIVNGQVANEAWDVEELAGKIALQSEGTEINFRNVRLAPIP